MGFPGFAIGHQLGEQNLQHRRSVEDEERQAQLANIANSGLTPEAQREAIHTLYAGNPSALKQHIENLAGRLVGRKPQPTPMAYAPESATTQAPAVNLPGQEVPISTPALPAAKGTPGVPASTLPGMAGGGISLPAPRPVTVSSPGAKTQQERLSQLLAGGTTPEQRRQQLLDEQLQQFGAEGDIQNRQAEEKAQQTRQATFNLIDTYIKDPAENKAAKEDYVRKQAGIMASFKNIPGAGGQPYQSPTGQWVRPVQAADGTITEQPMPAGWKPPAPKPASSPGAQYMRALVKKNSGQPMTPEDEAALKSYPEYVRQTSVIPGVARGQAYAEFRPMTVINPQNPQQTMVVTAGQAERGGFATPQSISYVMDSAGHKAMIPRNLGQNLASLQTAEDHLQMLAGMIDALGNGNYPTFNAAAVRFAQATGDPAPTNFDTLKTALEGEMARAYTGVGATQQEIAQIGATLDRANSPQALRGAIETAHKAMGQRKKNLWQQMNAATNVPLTSVKQPAPKTISSKPNGAIGTVTFQGKRYWVDKEKNNLGEVK